MNYLSIEISASLGNFTLTINQKIKTQGIIGIFGHSGSGKSSLLRIIAGLEKRVKGSITFNGQCLFNSDREIFVKAEQRNIALVFQDHRLFPHLTVLGNLKFAVRRCCHSRLKLADIIALTDLSKLQNKSISQLSGGEQQRVALARAILAEPSLLLLDEPLSALDKNNKIKMLALLNKVQQTLNIPILYVSHSLAELQHLADNLLILSQGMVLDYGDTHQVIHRLNKQGDELINQQTSLALPIKEHDSKHGLTSLSLTKNYTIYLPLLSTQQSSTVTNIGKKIRCFILAGDISISLTEPTSSSIVNHLFGKITALEQQNDHSCLVTVNCYQQLFFVQISTWSQQHLKLAINLKIFIQFKAGAVRTFNRINAPYYLGE